MLRMGCGNSIFDEMEADNMYFEGEKAKVQNKYYKWVESVSHIPHYVDLTRWNDDEYVYKDGMGRHCKGKVIEWIKTGMKLHKEHFELYHILPFIIQYAPDKQLIEYIENNDFTKEKYKDNIIDKLRFYERETVLEKLRGKYIVV